MSDTSRTRNPYMGAPVELSELPNGALVNAASRSMLARSMYPTPTCDRVAPGVTVFGGDTILNLTVIEGDDGLIVYDTGEDGERFLAQIRSLSDKPIVAILYSHAHYVHGARQLVGDGTGVRIIGHPKLNENLRHGGAGTLFPETAPPLTSRAMQQFNQFVAPSGPDGDAATINPVPPVEAATRLVEAMGGASASSRCSPKRCSDGSSPGPRS